VFLRFVADLFLDDLKLASFFVQNELFAGEDHPLIGFNGITAQNELCKFKGGRLRFICFDFFAKRKIVLLLGLLVDSLG